MATSKLAHSDYYVYLLLRENGETPFYVGKGRNGRWLVHEKEAFRGTNRKDRIIQSMHARGINPIPKIKVAEGLNEESAFALEIALIASIGRMPRGPLANHTNGGDGVRDLSDEARAKFRAANIFTWADPIVRNRRVKGLKAAWENEQKRRSHRSKIIQIFANPEVRKRRMAWRSDKELRQKWELSVKAAMNTDAVRALRTAAINKRWEDPEFRKFMSDKARAHRHSEDTKSKMRASGIARWNNAETSAKYLANKRFWSESDKEKQRVIMTDPALRAKLNAANASPEVRERRIAAQKAAFSTPEAKARRSAVSKAVWEKRKATHKN